MSHVEPEHNRPQEEEVFPRILEPREIRSKHCADAVNRTWARRKKEGRTKRHPNQKLNYHGKDR